MKLVDVAKRIDKSNLNETCVNIEDIGYDLGVDVPYTEQDRLKGFWVGNWYCTDSYVGYRMYFFDDEPVAFSVQKGRKCSEDFGWFSLESAIKVKQYLQTLIPNEELRVSICDINEDIGDSFTINFNSQILKTDRITLNNEKVEILERIRNKQYGIDTALKIKRLNGEEQQVEVGDLEFGFHIL